MIILEEQVRFEKSKFRLNGDCGFREDADKQRRKVNGKKKVSNMYVNAPGINLNTESRQYVSDVSRFKLFNISMTKIKC